MGLNLNRYKLAQQSPINEAKSLAMGNDLIEITETNPEECIKKIRNMKLNDGIYFLGFDSSHVGYLYKKNDKIFIIHSNFLSSEGVIIEKIEESEVFLLFNHFYIAEISTNEDLLIRWSTNEKIKIVS